MAASLPSLANLRPALLAIVAALAIPVAFAASTSPVPNADARKSPEAAAPDAGQLFRAVVKVSARAVPNARSAASLGSAREGSGILIGSDEFSPTLWDAETFNRIEASLQKAAGAGSLAHA